MIPSDMGDGPWRVWLHLPTGCVARYFEDEDEATVFAVRNGSKAEHAPIQF
jgi:hypothetical protein